MSFILSTSFTGLLLNTFFNIKSIPVVNTLQDIRKNKKLLIGGDGKYLSLITGTGEFDLKDIIDRMDGDKKYIYNFEINVNHIINSKGVILLNTLFRRVFMEMTKFYYDRIFVSGTKYFPDFASFSVHKHRNFSKLIEYW